MSNKKIWFITGAGRGMGVDFAKAALAAGHTEQRVADLKAQIDAHRDLSTSLDFDQVGRAGSGS